MCVCVGGGGGSCLFGASCASPESIICRLSSSPSLTQSHLHDVKIRPQK
jgi:hypothetical protein